MLPFSEKAVKDKFWSEEPWDVNLPKKPSFITDFVLSTRGIESPSLFCTWTALWTVSSVLRRNAWLLWHPRPFYPNIYVILIAPPRLNAKSTVIDYGLNAIRAMPLTLNGHTPVSSIYVPVIQDKTSPEKLLDRLVPQPMEVRVGAKRWTFPVDSQAAIPIPELGTLLGRQKYNEGMVSNLMRLYDCPDVMEVATLTRGVQTLRNVYVTIMAGTTPKALSSTIPESATEEGLLSRMIPVFQHQHSRCFPIPRDVKGGPSLQNLAERLVWISLHHRGPHKLTDEAFKEYDHWYRDFKVSYSRSWETRMMQARMDNYVLKVAFLLRVSRYEEGNDIEVTDIREAIAILNSTYAHAADALADVGSSTFQQHLRSAERKIREENIVSRRDLLTSIRWLNAGECTQSVNQLYQEGKIKIRLGGQWQKYASTQGKEQYHWLLSDKKECT